MRRLTLPLITLVISLFLLPMEAEAKRFGGGSSFGKSYSTPQRSAPTRQQEATPSRNNQAAVQRSGMGGMMGGLLAGGLLAALFMGGAFEGVQLMDFLLLGLLGFLIFKVVSAMRAGQRQQQQPAYAAPRAQHDATDLFRKQPASDTFSDSGSDMSHMLAEPELTLPEWFDKDSFLEGAQQHFTHLQHSWDNQAWDEIAEYTSIELLHQLQAERARHAADQHTEVVSVMAELVNFIDEGDHVVASIHFYGWMREEQNGETAEFSETWHLNRDMSGQGGNWVIVGIEQTA
ncbi:Tim44 domain-containing protein [Nitrincola sp. MINF-07-Sa-05]|uniref:Tim44 domain-containing protein n=1 Tax=Nitrincola salilacus TaxID=3400273 RepID=UPI0039184680